MFVEGIVIESSSRSIHHWFHVTADQTLTATRQQFLPWTIQSCPKSANEKCAVQASACNKRHFNCWQHIHQATFSPVFSAVYDIVINMFNDGTGCYLSVLARYPACTTLDGQVGISRWAKSRHRSTINHSPPPSLHFLPFCLHTTSRQA